MSRIALALGILLGLALLVFVLVQIDAASLIAVFSQADMWSFAVAHLLLGSAFLVKAVRWSLLLRPLSVIPWLQLVYPVLAGNAGNAIIPHSGEILRSAMVSQSQGVRVTPVLTGIAVERMFDFLAVMCLSMSIVFARDITGPLSAALRFVAIGFCVLLAFFILFLFRASLFERIFTWSISFLPTRISSILSDEYRAASTVIRTLMTSHSLLRILVLSVIQWVLIGACVYASILAAGVNAPLVVSVGVLLLTVAGLTLPTAPGYIGTLQACFVIGMSGYATKEEALVASLLYNFVVTVPVILAAIPALSMHSLRSSRKREDL